MTLGSTRPWLALGTLALAAAATWFPQQAKEDPQTAIRILLAAQQSDWNRGDIPAFMAGYWNSPDLTFAGSRGFTRGWQPVLERYEKTYPGKEAMGRLDYSELEIRPLGPDAALVLGRWHLQRQAGDVGGIFTLVLRRFPDGWRIIHDHTTQNPQEPN
jgi:beta-aspartyl-peptidase (threonine type)